MIEFYSENSFELPNEERFKEWLTAIAEQEGYIVGELSYIFCDDEYLLQINQEFLQHDTLTDIITFDYNLGKEIHGEIYISTERVSENAEEFKENFMNELARVVVHGMLHLCGYKDKNEEEERAMRTKENESLQKALFLST